MKPSYSNYLKSWSTEFDATCNRVRDLIGDAHWLTDGHHKEKLLKNFLERYIPSGLTVSNGFIFNPWSPNNVSGEIDLMILDHSKHPPIFSEHSVAIVFPESVKAIIHVKSSFNATELKDICKSNNNICNVINEGNCKHPAIFSFFFSIKPKSIPETTINNLRNSGTRISKMHICINNQLNIITSDPKKNKKINSKNLSSAIFYSDLIDSISDNKTKTKFSRLLESLEITTNLF